MASFYQTQIKKALEQKGIEADPRHIEAFMRLEHPTLNHLSAAEFAEEINIGLACIAEVGDEEAERTAQSFGL